MKRTVGKDGRLFGMPIARLLFRSPDKSTDMQAGTSEQWLGLRPLEKH